MRESPCDVTGVFIMREDVAQILISEEEFRDVADNKLVPWIEKDFTKGKVTSFDGTRLAYYYNINPDEKASVVICHGMGEFFPKYYEMSYYFYNMGYSVFFIEHRGFGFSDRAVEQLDHIYVKSYSEYVDDFHEYMDKIVTKQSKTKKYVLFAHSMGGCIGTLFLEKYPEYFKTAILSSPMHRMSLGKFKPWQVKIISAIMVAIGKDNDIVPGQKEFDGVNVWETSSSISKARYDFQFDKRLEVPEYTTYGGTYAWTRASIKASNQCLADAGKIKIPILLCEAGLDTLVDNDGHTVFVASTDNTTLRAFPESKHEIFNGTPKIREEYWNEVFDYIDSNIGR